MLLRMSDTFVIKLPITFIGILLDFFCFYHNSSKIKSLNIYIKKDIMDIHDKLFQWNRKKSLFTDRFRSHSELNLPSCFISSRDNIIYSCWILSIVCQKIWLVQRDVLLHITAITSGILCPWIQSFAFIFFWFFIFLIFC